MTATAWILIILTLNNPPVPVYGFQTESACIVAGRKVEDAIGVTASGAAKERVQFRCVKAS